MNLGQIFDQFLKIMQESFGLNDNGFSFSKLFADDLSYQERICLHVEARA